MTKQQQLLNQTRARMNEATEKYLAAEAEFRKAKLEHDQAWIAYFREIAQ